MDKVPFQGGCACGEIRYECVERPLRMVNCHCRDYQRSSGSGYSPTLAMAANAVRVVKGAPKSFASQTDAGNVATRHFCGVCGSPLFAQSNASAQYVGIKAASLDDPAWFHPEADVWTASAQPWDCRAADVPKFPKSRPRPAK